MGTWRWIRGAAWAAAVAAQAADPRIMPLDGRWSFRLDPQHEGAARRWFATNLPDTVSIPGTTDTNRKGLVNSNRAEVMHLSRPWRYVGPAWYQRTVRIPEDWRGRRIVLFLERTRQTTVWVDDQPAGESDAHAVPQLHDLSAGLTPGAHRITVCVDNARKPPVGGHQWSDDTQTDWNGLVGRVELQATDPVWLDDVQVHPDVVRRSARVRAVLGSRAGRPGYARLAWTLRARPAAGAPGPRPGALAGTQTVAWAAAGGETTFTIELGPQARPWDEFQPSLYELELRMDGVVFRIDGDAAAAGAPDPARWQDARTVPFGLREFASEGGRLLINGRPVLLRGRHDACVFPLTGFAPMDVEGWRRYFRIVRDYGLNHVRFHTWCPPEAAFAAADEAGVYLQPELPNFGGDLGKNTNGAAFVRAEGRRILKAYGNHPSFAMFALGNEMFGGRDTRAAIVRELREADPRRLYAQASNYEFNDLRFAEGDDYWTTFRTRPGAEGAVRGSFSHADLPLGHIQAGPPGTMRDYSRAIAGIPAPVIGHEVGQFQVFPRFAEAARYTGVLRAWNFDAFRERLRARGMLDQADDFVRASGALAVRCYREEIEAALRTPRFGGFQLLDLQDFPGQGTALVGILDAFLESKGLIEPAAWREFCRETVPLARMARRTWTQDEAFAADIQLAHYGTGDLAAAEIEWTLAPSRGRAVAQGRLASRAVKTGEVADLGAIGTALAGVRAPARVELSLRLAGTDVRNRYDLWVYPAAVDPAVPTNVLLARALDGEAASCLAQGGRVLLLPPATSLVHAVDGFFAPDFWCYPMFRRICEGGKKAPAPGTLGLLCDPGHGALAGFPTDFHSDWQWFDIVMASKALILDDLPAGLRPVVQVIDNFERNHRLGLVFEARVGPGRLLVCAADLDRDLASRPAARQLRRSLLDYAAGPGFRPAVAVDPADLARLLGP